MKQSQLVLAGIAAVSLMIASVASANSGGMGMGPMMGPMMGGMHGPGPMAGNMQAGGPSAMVESRLASLKAELKITADQESAWQAFSGKARQQAETMQAMRGKMQSAAGSAPERMDQRSEMMRQRIGAMDSMSAAMKDLYAVLSPEQKAIADQRFGMMGGRPMAMAPIAR
ncbi:MAG: Spy/CpxP family protein refolding chaperone [Azonexus sp.]